MVTRFNLPMMDGHAGDFLRVNLTENDYEWAPLVFGQAYRTIESNGTPETQRSILNFSALFTVSDNLGNVSTDVTINVSALANDSTFVSDLVANTTFLDDLVASTHFLTALTSSATFVSDLLANTTFTTNLGTNSNFITSLTSSATFVNDLIANNTFTTNLANSSNFITALSSNSTFVTDLTSNSNFISAITTIVTTGGGLPLETNGTPNGSQALLNLVAGANMSISDDGLGNITFDASGVSGSADLFFGDASDGTVVFDGTSVILGITPISMVYTLTRDIYCDSMTVDSGVIINTAGYSIFARLLTGAGTIQHNGNKGGNASGATPGAAGAAPAAVTVPASAAGGIGGSGSSSIFGPTPAANGVSTTNAVSSALTGGSDPSSSGGFGGTSTEGPSSMHTATDVFQRKNYAGLMQAAPGGGGGQGGQSGSNAAGASGGGGGGGSGGGFVFIAALRITGTLTIRSLGGDGGDGANAVGITRQGGNGGSSGPGGIISVITTTAINPLTFVVTKGTHGTGGTSTSGGAASQNGGDGTDGLALYFVL